MSRLLWPALFAMTLAVPSNVFAASPFSDYTVAAKYDGIETTSQLINSFDGTRIAITVYRPTLAGQSISERLPVVVTQARSDERPQTIETIRYFTQTGYVWIAQDRRGTGASFGVQTGFVNDLDAKDAKAVIEWSGAQVFSNGKVAAYGCSNQGAWQYLVMKYQPKFLVAISPQCASPQFFDHGITLNGVPMIATGAQHYAGECARPSNGARPATNAAASAEPAVKPVDEDKDGALLQAAREAQRCGASSLGQYWLDMTRDGYNSFSKTKPAIDDTALSLNSWRDVKNSGVAILQIGGFFDAAVAGQFEGQRVWGGKLIMGPWVHGNGSNADQAFPGSDIDLNAQILAWFDHYTKGVKNGAEVSKVVYYTQNAPKGAAWREANHWQAAAGTKKTYFFSGTSLSLVKPAAKAEPAEHAQKEVRWLGGKYLPLRRYVKAEDTSISARQSLTFTLEALTADVEVTGTPVARLWVSADQRDVNVYAMLEDVAPDGTANYVSDGRLRASWRKVTATPWGRSAQTWHRGYAVDIAPLTPGDPTKLDFDFFPTSYVFKKGHRVRLSLVTSIGENYQAPPLAGGKPITLKVFRDSERPSAIELPIVGMK